MEGKKQIEIVTNMLGREIEVEVGDWVVVPGEGFDVDWGQVSMGEWGLVVAWEGAQVRTSMPTCNFAGVYATRAEAEAAYDVHVIALSEDAAGFNKNFQEVLK